MTTTLSQISTLRPATVVTGSRAESAESTTPQSLSQAVQHAVRWVDDAALRRVASQDAGPGFEPRTLLAVMTYCYAREIYSSIDIEEMLRRDQPFRNLCQNEFPGARVFRKFRRENRDILQSCLFQVLQWSLAGAPAQGPSVISDEDIALATSRRMSAAMFVDSMEQLD